MSAQDEIAQQYAELIGEVSKFADAWLRAIAPVVKVLGEASVALTEACRTAYRNAGEPLGPGDKAMFEWMRIEAEFANAVEAARRERAFQIGIRRIKAKTAANRS